MGDCVVSSVADLFAKQRFFFRCLDCGETLLWLFFMYFTSTAQKMTTVMRNVTKAFWNAVYMKRLTVMNCAIEFEMK